MQNSTTIDKAEIQKFQAMADEWWDPNGKFKPLHMLNPCRLQYIVEQITIHFRRNCQEKNRFKDLRILDIGCGGGLLSEPMARLGASVVGADAAERNIRVAKLHADQSELEIDYRHSTAEELVHEKEKFDVILNMEVIEHVAEPSLYLSACYDLLSSGGLMICSTINRNMKSYLYAIIGAEYVMRWLPRGTHEWDKFITPNELFQMLNDSGFSPLDKKGFYFDKLRWEWSVSQDDLSVNYVSASTRVS